MTKSASDESQLWPSGDASRPSPADDEWQLFGVLVYENPLLSDQRLEHIRLSQEFDSRS